MTYDELQAKHAETVRNAWKAPPSKARTDAAQTERPGIGAFGWKPGYSEGEPEQHADERADASERSIRFGVDEIREDAAPGCSCDGGTCTCPDGARFTGNVAKCLSNGSCKHVAADAVDVDALMFERFHSRGEIPRSMSLDEFRVTYGHGPREDSDDTDELREDGIPDAAEAQARLQDEARNAWRQ